MRILYLCNRKKRCGGTRYCGGEYCNHTEDENYALNGPCNDPENNERFMRWEQTDCFMERLQQNEKCDTQGEFK